MMTFRNTILPELWTRFVRSISTRSRTASGSRVPRSQARSGGLCYSQRGSDAGINAQSQARGRMCAIRAMSQASDETDDGAASAGEGSTRQNGQDGLYDRIHSVSPSMRTKPGGGRRPVLSPRRGSFDSSRCRTAPRERGITRARRASRTGERFVRGNRQRDANARQTG